VAIRRGGEPLDGALAAVPVRATLAEARGAGPAAVIVCTPTAHHVRDALAAVAAGCDVLIEKPLSDRIEGIDELRAAVAAGQRIAGVAHCLRFHPVVSRVREELAGLGRPIAAAVWCGQHLPDWRPGSDHRASYSARAELGGGVLLDLSHEPDYLQWLLGPATAVSAMARNTGVLDIETEDVADLLLQHPSGVVSSCHLDYLARPAIRGGWIAAERGALRWDVQARTAERSAGDGWTALAVGTADMYVAELDAFVKAVAARAPFPVGIDDATPAVRVAVAAKRSAADCRMVATT
jgi:predicted dehydrogenase